MGSARYRISDGQAFFESIPFSQGRIVATSEGTQAEYHLKDRLGSVRVVTDEDAKIKARYDYLPYGEQHIDPEFPTSDDNDFRFTGKEWLGRFTGLALYDSKARLQGIDGRFLSPDPKADSDPGTSPYAYCAGNPVMKIDPDGEKWVNADDKLMWDDKGYTEYATDEFKRIAIAARATPTGREAFDIIANGPGKTRLEISQKIKLNSDGGLIRGKHVFHDAYIAPNGKYCIAESSIIVFENAIKKETSGFIKTEGSIADLIHQLPIKIAEQVAMGSVLVHEAIHGTSENLKQNAENTIDARKNRNKRHDIEKEPLKWQAQYLREIFNQ